MNHASGRSSTLSSNKKTLDTQHTNKLNDFQASVHKMSSLKDRIQNLSCIIQEYDTKRKTQSLSKEEYDTYIQKIDEREEVKKMLETIETDEDELEYLVNTGSILFKYYDIMEKGNDDDVAPTPKLTGNSILKYFIKKEDIPSVEDPKEEVQDRASLLDTYMSYVDENYVGGVPCEVHECCDNCGSTNRNILLNDGIVFCNECSCVEYIIVDHDRPSYKDPPREISYFSYKRINHLNEWLSQIQGKETTEIPEEIYDQILLEIKKQQITNMAELKTSKIKEILKKIRQNKYYEHAAHIKHKLNGLPIPHLEPELEEKLRTMFKLIQPPFLKYMPPSRKNFLSYSYVLHKCIQLLGRDEYLVHFPLLKSREKLHQQDQIWKKICEELNWEFLRSI